MKRNPLIFLGYLLVGPLLFNACLPKEEVLVNPIDPEGTLVLPTGEWKQVETAKEFSQLLGQVLLDKGARITLSEHIRHYDSFGDAVSLSALLGDKQRMPPSELAQWDREKINAAVRTGNPFREVLLAHSLKHFEAYPFLEKAFENFRARPEQAQQRVSLQEELIAFFASQGLVIHFPYEEQFDWQTYDGGITTTYDPIIREDWNEGFLYSLTGSGSSGSLVPYVDDAYSFQHPTLVVTYLDEDFYELQTTPPVPELPKPAADAVILDYNVNHTSISQADILFSTIPEVKLTGRDYLGLFGRIVKVRLYRGSSKVQVNFDGTIGSSAQGETYRYDEIRFSKDDIKLERWKTVNIQFDPDWDLSENSQQFFLFTEHNLTGKAKASAGVKVGYDFLTKKPTAEATGTVQLEVESGGSRFRVNSELPRRSVLAYIVGPTDHGVRTRNGIDFNVKSVGLLHYYFEHRFTDIPD
ncbi:MAG: hypothetical protein ACK5BR_04055 [Bacteroidota bacterium]|jgi:hypothetical protein|nr:hypothetical protein [Algoriphagus sp.]